MNEVFEIVRELGSLGVVVVLVYLAARHLEQQRIMFARFIEQTIELISELCKGKS